MAVTENDYNYLIVCINKWLQFKGIPKQYFCVTNKYYAPGPEKVDIICIGDTGEIEGTANTPYMCVEQFVNEFLSYDNEDEWAEFRCFLGSFGADLDILYQLEQKYYAGEMINPITN